MRNPDFVELDRLAGRAPGHLGQDQETAVLTFAVMQMGSAALTFLRIGIQARHPANRLHLIISDFESKQITIKFERTLHIADADSHVRDSVHWLLPPLQTIMISADRIARLCRLGPRRASSTPCR